MNYGFVINNNDCIGCHACSTACKSENEVPLGVNRTWVKSVETGAYPDVSRSFQVTRCNHCANPPCVRICPVTAMYQRSDGIVEFDAEACIGCKACLQACPYDAIYVDPESGTAAKCHYCAHRVDVGLEPACVVVCPEHAILAGDLDDPESEISRVLAKNQVTVRKPEQGTAPNLFYIGGHDVALQPTAHAQAPDAFAWADVLDKHPPTAPSASAQGLPSGGAIQIGEGRMAGQMTQVVYNAQHRMPWHWPVPAYLVTKGLGAGLFLLLALGYGLGGFGFDAATFVAGGFLTLLFMGLTTALLVFDLERPERFLRILTRPQWKSWLTKGAFLLIGFSLVVTVWWLLEAGAYGGLWASDLPAAIRPFALWTGVPLAVGVAVYTAFLFGQAEGRDLWQSTLLPVHLLIQATMLGGAALLGLALLMPLPAEVIGVARMAFLVSLILDVLVTLMGEFGMPHASETAARAAHMISHGRYRVHFWLGSIVLGHALPLALMFLPHPAWAALAGLLSIIGLYLYEYAFVMAPQQIPNS